MENIHANSRNGEEIQYPEILENEIGIAGGPIEPPSNDGRVGVTMFDVSGSEDNLIAVVVPKEHLKDLPAQSLVKIGSLNEGDGRIYQGIVVKGPFYEPDGIRGDSAVIITTAANGMMFMPKYHGRVMVEIMGELLNGTPVPPRYRPMPNSPVYPLSNEESTDILNLNGEIILGRAIGHEDMMLKIPAQKKSVLPRHIGILGTTGGGKSTTVSGLVNQFQKNDIATILIDTEGEYTHINQPSENTNMLNILERRGLSAKGISETRILHLVGRETTNPDHNQSHEFTLHFDQLSPYAVMEILDFSEAQQQRYLKSVDIGRVALKRLGIFPSTKLEEESLYELDELTTGYPKMTLDIMYDIVSLCAKKAGKEKMHDDNGKLTFFLRSKFKGKEEELIQVINSQEDLPGSVPSWRAIQGLLSQLLRLKIFDNPDAKPFNFDDLTTPGRVSIIDMSDTDSPKIRNLVIAELLKGLMDKQNENYGSNKNNEQDLPKVMVVIEEAHEFLSAQRVKQMPILYDQVARIAKRGRKRWLGLTFVTQLPQHLPDDVLALLNNFILHKISDANVVSRLKRTVGGIDEGLWDKMKNLSAGQAVVKFNHMTRGMLVAIDPTPCKLLMED
ncbi:MAG: ATP-binding protein [Saprospiraceae bacterium]|nr:ATP-binding protein [Saprospiraceae bacterium]